MEQNIEKNRQNQVLRIVIFFIITIFIITAIIVVTISSTLDLVNKKEAEFTDKQLIEFDDETIERLRKSVGLIDTYYEKASEIDSKRTGQVRPMQKRLPSDAGSLSLVTQSSSEIIKDIQYKNIGLENYVLCADFKSSNLPPKSDFTIAFLFNKDEIEKPATLGSWYHGVGYYCFEIKVSSEAQSENAPAKYGIKSDKDNFIKAQSGNKSINNSF